MAHPRWFFSACVLIAGCAPASVMPIPAPTAVPVVAPSSMESLGPCDTSSSCTQLTGTLYDASGAVVTIPARVSYFDARDPERPLASAEVRDGRYTLLLRAGYPGAWLTVTGEGFASRRRRLDWRRTYTRPPNPLPAGPTWVTNFGGPAASDDPDAPAYFLPPAGQNGEDHLPDPALTVEPTRVTTLAEGPLHDGPGYPFGLAVEADGQVLVTGNDRLYRVAPTGSVTLIAGGPRTSVDYQPDATLVDGPALDARFYGPSDLVRHPDGRMFIADTSNSAIRSLSPAGVVSTFAGQPLTSADQLAPDQLQAPTGLAFVSRGHLFVADIHRNRIFKVSPAGVVTPFAGSDEGGYANGQGAIARFRSPRRVAVDGQDNVYVADTGNHRIRKITPAGLVSDVYGSPTSQPGGAALMPAVLEIETLAVDAAGDLFVGSQFRVYRIRPDGRVTVVAGSGERGVADGDAQTASFGVIVGLTRDTGGRLFLTEGLPGRVRRIDFLP